MEAAPVGRVQLQSRADAVLARALRAPPLAAGTIASTRYCFATQCGTVRLPDESVEVDDEEQRARRCDLAAPLRESTTGVAVPALSLHAKAIPSQRAALRLPFVRSASEAV